MRGRAGKAKGSGRVQTEEGRQGRADWEQKARNEVGIRPAREEKQGAPFFSRGTRRPLDWFSEAQKNRGCENWTHVVKWGDKTVPFGCETGLRP